MDEFVNYYTLLEIEVSASEREISEAIKKQRTVWSSRSSREGATGDKARRNVEKITEAERILLDPARRAEYDKELLADKKPKPVVPEGEKDWLHTAWRYCDDKDWEMARSAIRKATQQQPNNVEAWYLAGEIYIMLKDYTAANEASYEAILLDEDNPYAYGLRGDVFRFKGDLDKASEQYKKMKARTGDYPKLKQVAIEHLALIAMLQVDKELDEGTKSLPDGEFYYNDSTMAAFSNAIEWLEYAKSKTEKIYNGIDNPSDWITGIYQEIIKSHHKRIAECTRIVNEGNESVTKWDKAGGPVVIGVVIALIGFALLFSGCGGVGIVLLLVGSSISAGSWAVYTKPRYKW